MPRQGVLPRQRHLLPQQLSRQKCMEVNSLKRHGKGQLFGMLRLALIPAIAGTRAPLSMTSLKHVGKVRRYRTIFEFENPYYPCSSVVRFAFVQRLYQL